MGAEKRKINLLFIFVLAIFFALSLPMVVHAEALNDTTDQDAWADNLPELKEGKNIIISGQTEEEMKFYRISMPYDGYLRFANAVSEYEVFELVDGERKQVGTELSGGVTYYIGFYGKAFNNEYIWTTRVTFVPRITNMTVTPIRKVTTYGLMDPNDVRFTLNITYSDGTTEKISSSATSVYTNRLHSISISYISGGKRYYSFEKLPKGNAKVVLTPDSGVGCSFYMKVQGLEDSCKSTLKFGTNTINYNGAKQDETYFKFVPGKTASYSIGLCDEVAVYELVKKDDKEQLSYIDHNGGEYIYEDITYETIGELNYYNLKSGHTYLIKFHNNKFKSSLKICIAYAKTKDLKSSGHCMTWKIYRATNLDEGYKIYKCSVCGMFVKSEEIARINYLRLSPDGYIYTGKTYKPRVTAYDGSGKVIPSTNYTVQYINADKVGTGVVKVRFDSKYYIGTLTDRYYIGAATPKITSVKNVSGGVKVTWNKVKGAEMYYVHYDNKKLVTKNTSIVIKMNGSWPVTFSVVAAGKNGYGKSDPSKEQTAHYAVPIVLKSVKNTAPGVVTWSGKGEWGMPYQLQYSTDAAMKNAKYYYGVTSGEKDNVTDETGKIFTPGKKYYIRIRVYYKYGRNGKTQNTYSAWSGIKSVYIKN